ncbi:LTA synthase family protein [Vibrio cincinnatiensis]|uniref:LTA synthase family protein n=1 Tax=Vibrio cincinnatiensis TaxID=675 RepID=UPI001EE02944|nr:LTA synthase family protein [Vibrio cincinnatiensis]MCG3759557.1 LTA synthase family protein [Vibrio cincinnatiensis]MCG3762859.1 LTA synthase family protein [Vibrio cincinnatiensis]
MHVQNHFCHLFQVLALYFIFSLLLLLFSRFALYLYIEPNLPTQDIADDIRRAFWVGMRFDAKVTAIAYSPLLLAGLFCAPFDKAYQRWCGVSVYYHTLVAFLYVIGGIGNYYYYLTYGSHVDLFIFGLVDDDSIAVLKNLWSDYPIIWGSLGTGMVASGSYYFAKFLTHQALWQPKRSWHWSVTSMVVIGVTLSVFIIARGSLGSLPLKRYHASVSAYKPLNMLTPNVFMALDWARSDYQEQAHIEPISQQVLQEQMYKILGKPTPDYRTQENEYLAENPPHVVVAMMESMGLSLLLEDNPETNDLLGSFRHHYRKDFLFERFVAGTSATIDSIAMMLVHSPLPTISHSNLQKVALPSSAVLPYKEAGYEVVFIYGGNGMWRNLANYLPIQGFDRVYDENDIIEAFPSAGKEAGTWGVPDGFTFKFARQILDKAQKPTFVYIMTVTNHSPYHSPDYYQPTPTSLNDRLNELLGYKGEGDAKELLETFQYASNALGNFIQGIKQSALKEKAVIAVTGDHRVRYTNTARPGEAGLTHAVPFYLYVPTSILAHTNYQYDPNRIGSHRDVFPTLYYFSLSDKPYISLGGENLLSTEPVSNIGYNTGMVINQNGAVNNAPPFTFYPWQAGETLLTEKQPSDDHCFNRQWGQEYHQLQEYFLRSQVFPMTP